MKLKATKLAACMFGLMSLSGVVLADAKVDAFEAATQNDYKKAAIIWANLAERGDAQAQFNLAMTYHSGTAGVLNEEKALQWYKKAAANGHPRAQEYLIVGYREGWFGLKKNESKARHWEAKLNQ